MVEQYVEKYEVTDLNSITNAQNDMNDNVSRGWTIKSMVVTPDLPWGTKLYPFIVVVYEREVKSSETKEQNIS